MRGITEQRFAGIVNRRNTRLRQVRVLVEEISWVHIDQDCDALQSLKGQVPFATFQSTHVGAMHPEMVRKTLLTQAHSLPVQSQIAAHYPLKLALHNERLHFPLAT